MSAVSRVPTWLDHLGTRGDLPTYLGALLATASWYYVVGTTIGSDEYVELMLAVTALGFAFSFWTRGLSTPRAVAWVEWWAHGGGALLRTALFVTVLLGAFNIGPLPSLLPEAARGQEETVMGAVFVWGMTIYSFGVVTDGFVAFSSVLGTSMMGLMGGDNINPEIGVGFLFFLLGNLLMLGNMALVAHAGRHRRGPTGRAMARWVGDQFIVAGITVSLSAGLGLLGGMVLQVVSPRLLVPGMRLAGQLALKPGPMTAPGFAAFANEMSVGQGSGPGAEVPVFRVRCEKRLLWRRRVYDHFEDRTWSVWASDTSRLPQPLKERLTVASNDTRARRDGPVTLVRQQFDFVARAEFAAAPYVVSITFGRPRHDAGFDVTVYGDVALAMAPDEVLNVESLVPTPSIEQLRAAPPARRDEFETFLIVPTTAAEAVEKTAALVAGTARTPYDQAVEIQNYIESNFIYDDTARVPESSPSIMEYYLTHRRGACDLIATAMALMARARGIPARVVSGYATGDPQPDGSYQVCLKHAHAWAELYFPGCGWIAFNPAVPGDDLTPVAGSAAGAAWLHLRWNSILAAALACWLLVYALRERRRTRPRFDTAPPGVVARAYHLAQRHLARRGLGRRRWETPREHLDRLAAEMPGATFQPACAELVGIYERVRYGLGAVDEAQAAAAEAAGRALARELRRMKRVPR